MTNGRTAVSIKRVAREDAAWRRRFRAFYADSPRPDHGAVPHAYFAAWSGRTLAGHSEVRLENGRWILDGLRVRPAFRERGIGKKLTAARIRYAAGLGAKRIWYACDDGNLVTICCHLRFGFAKVCPEGRSCTLATAHWYTLKITKTLLDGLDRLSGS